MDPDNPVPSPSDIAELQRECHPFPAYIDYIQGQPTEYERCTYTQEAAEDRFQDDNDNHLLAGQIGSGNALGFAGWPTMPAHPQLHSFNDFQYGEYATPASIASSYPSFGDPTACQIPTEPTGPTAQPSLTISISGQSPLMLAHSMSAFTPPMPARPIATAPQSVLAGAPHPGYLGSSSMAPFQGASNAPSVPPPSVRTRRILQPDDLLKPDYDWLPQYEITGHVRAQSNARAAQLHDIVENMNVPSNGRAVAAREFALLSARFTGAEQMKEAYRRIHNQMVHIYNAVKLKQNFPTHQNAVKADEWIQKLARKYKGHVWDYILRLLAEMDKKRVEGKVPYEAVPGWLEGRNREHTPKDGSQQVAELGGEVEQSKGESSPLPVWKSS